MIEKVKEGKKGLGGIDIVVGNVGRGEGGKMLGEGGGDGVKVGMGGGCMSRSGVVGGVGVGELRGVYDVGKGLEGRGIGLIGDGGLGY